MSSMVGINPTTNTASRFADLRGAMGVKIKAILSHGFRILVVCVIVGAVLHFFGVDALDAVRMVSKIIRNASDWAIDVMAWIMPRLMLGAVVVVPVVIVVVGVRLLKRGRRG